MRPCGAMADADTALLNEHYDVARQVCGGISTRLEKLKTTTTVNTVVSGAGTVAAGGALYAGIKKADIDKQIEALQKQICDAGGCDPDTVEAMSDGDFLQFVLEPIGQIAELERLQQKSKNAGNWRTGLLAGASATNIASAIIAGINKNQSDLIQQIVACNNAMELIGELNTSGINPFENPVAQKINAIKTQCKAIDVSDVEKFEKQQTVVMGTSIAGAATGIVGVATSAAANSDKIRKDNSDSGRKKEHNLNTTANVMAGATTVMGGVSTGFNIASITKLNKIIKQAKLCEELF